MLLTILGSWHWVELYYSLSQITLHKVGFAQRLTDFSVLSLYHNQTITKTTSYMETTSKTSVTVETIVKSPVDKVWKYWSEPKHITKWCQASDDWHAPHAKNDLRDGGEFKTTMAAKDGSFSFDFGGKYDKVIPHQSIAYTIADGRTVKIIFSGNGNETIVTETFEAETQNPIEMQRGGWQAILDNFKKYTEAN